MNTHALNCFTHRQAGARICELEEVEELNTHDTNINVLSMLFTLMLFCRQAGARIRELEEEVELTHTTHTRINNNTARYMHYSIQASWRTHS